MSIEKGKVPKRICGNCKHIQYYVFHDSEIWSCAISMEKTEVNAEACEDWEEEN